MDDLNSVRMVKKRRPSLVKPDHKLTEFFTRRSNATGPSQPNSSPSKPSVMPFKSKKAVRDTKLAINKSNIQDREVISISSDSHVSISSGSVIAPSDAKPKLRQLPPRASALKTSRRSQSVVPITNPTQLPSSQKSRVANPSPLPPKNINKRKKKFDSDSDVEILNTVICVPRQIKSSSVTNRSSPQLVPTTSKETFKSRNDPSYKKARFSSPVPPFAEEGRVPSSQSDEELTLPPPKKIGAVKETVERWRSNAKRTGLRSPTDDAEESDTNMALISDATPSTPPQSSFSDADALNPKSASTNLTSPCLTAPPVRGVTPPTSISLPPLPATPVALDAESKTAHIIAQIKANAYAMTVPSPEEQPLPEFKELDESSDEDDLNAPDWRPTLHVKSVPSRDVDVFSSPLSSPDSSPAKPAILPIPSCSGLTRNRSTTTQSSSIAKGKTDARKGKNAPTDIFDMLLKEKRLARKHVGSNRLTRSRAAGQHCMRSEMDGEDDSKWSKGQREHWSDEKAALENARIGFELAFESNGSPESQSPSGSNVVMKTEDQDRLLGSERGKAISELLADDRARQEKTQADGKVPGVSLWRTDQPIDDSMNVDANSLPLWGGNDSDADPISTLLKSAVKRRDIPRILLLLDSSVFVTKPPQHVVSWLCDLALSDHKWRLPEAAFHLLLHIWNSGLQVREAFPVSLVLRILLRLGADPSVLTTMGWTADVNGRNKAIDMETRAIAIYRLVALLTASARGGGLPSQNVPDVLLILHLIAIDPLSPLDLRRELMTAINAVCQSLPPDVDISPEIEINACNKLLSFAFHLSPMNKALFVSFLSGGCSRTLRIARWVAYCLLVDESMICVEAYANVPPLTPLIDLLSSDSEGPFAINSSTDYEDVGYYIELLSVVLSDVDSYVDDEHKAPQVDTGLKKIGKEKPLQIVLHHLGLIHSKIVDTRAAHLDRSKTKAALQRLSMRVYYQRMAALNSGDGPSNLLSWMVTTG